MISFNFDESPRTFVTRLSFIKKIFTNKFAKSDIMANCIQYKLGKSYIDYLKNLEISLQTLVDEDSDLDHIVCDNCGKTFSRKLDEE